jgi:[ribosomal protein S18]-alanine N-acetyltransferase
MTTVAVRVAPLRESDLPRCAELERVLFPGDDPWSLATLRSELRAGHRYFGAYAGETLIGYAGLAVVGRRDDREASVHTIGVDPAWQGRGVGTALLRTMLAVADELAAPVFLEVRTDNATAIRLYEAHGFGKLGLRRRYYQPSNADAYTMGRPAAGREGFE